MKVKTLPLNYGSKEKNNTDQFQQVTLTIDLQGGDAAYLTNLHAEFDSHYDYVKGEDRRRWDSEFGYSTSTLFVLRPFYKH